MLKIKDVRKMDINQRHKMILDAIVSMYIKNGEPVASQTLQDALNIRVSSATLRNEMAMLTKLGYLNQPHVSAGRVPTNKAYGDVGSDKGTNIRLSFSNIQLTLKVPILCTKTGLPLL